MCAGPSFPGTVSRKKSPNPMRYIRTRMLAFPPTALVCFAARGGAACGVAPGLGLAEPLARDFTGPFFLAAVFLTAVFLRAVFFAPVFRGALRVTLRVAMI